MNNEFTTIKSKTETRYVLESASVGGTSTGGGATVTKPLGSVMKRENMDHEISMASSELKDIVRNAIDLLKLIQKYSEMEGLEAWQQSKITKATDYISSVLRSIRNDQTDVDEETKRKGLYYYVNLRKKKGLPPKKPGEQGYPTKQSWDAAAKTAKKEDHSTMDQGWGQASYDAYAGTRHGRGVAEGQIDEYIEELQSYLESTLNEKAPPGDKYERMVKHIKKGYAKDGKLTKKEKSIAFATAWKAKNKAKK